MKRFFLYLVALTLLPQALSAAVLVGKTEGALSVSPTGAATYTIPIKVQNGLSEFSPSISLTYSSQSGNGIAGMGFSISGLSAISIVPRSVYFDGQAECIYSGEDNVFTLDGQRLLNINFDDWWRRGVDKSTLCPPKILSPKEHFTMKSVTFASGQRRNVPRYKTKQIS